MNPLLGGQGKAFGESYTGPKTQHTDYMYAQDEHVKVAEHTWDEI